MRLTNQIVTIVVLFLSHSSFAEIEINSPKGDSWAYKGDGSTVQIVGRVSPGKQKFVSFQMHEKLWKEGVLPDGDFKFNLPTKYLWELDDNEVKIFVENKGIKSDSKSIFIKCCSIYREGLLENIPKAQEWKMEFEKNGSEISGAGVFIPKDVQQIENKLMIVQVSETINVPDEYIVLGRTIRFAFLYRPTSDKLKYFLPFDWRPRNNFGEPLQFKQAQDHMFSYHLKSWPSLSEKSKNKIAVLGVVGSRVTLIHPSKVTDSQIEFSYYDQKNPIQQFVPVYVVDEDDRRKN